ncbi:DUF2199 domain-containing protein [Imperialibacter roseus]|uniref:DUF2199 domain-containing protein n=1 Tax=Imperialibacter roseus TaxID=1324217 RepID=A0ABZ0IJ25_9BACT|nr:DUF2199 domain-containing protein [Imperialibacter roseus]WOK04541.1 DUF2199 domain-containing protein [Imperialibacter roseus]
MLDISTFEFKCSCCDEIHVGIPSLGSKAPNYYFSIPEEEIEERVFLTSDTCVIDDEHFFIRGCLELPLIGRDDFFSFGAWVSLSEENFEKFESLFDNQQRNHTKPMYGWFSSWVWPFYEGSENIRSRIHLRNSGIRPLIELERTEHPLSRAQTEGISTEQVIEMYEHYVHGKKKA